MAPVLRAAAIRRALAGCLAGLCLGTLAWGEGRAPVLAIALPVAIVSCRSRWQAFWVGFGYATGVLRYAAGFIAGWFDHQVAIGLAAVLAYAVVTGAVWCAGWSGSRSFVRRALAISAAWLLALLAGIAVPGHPLVAAGYLLPGSGWAGCALAWLLPVVAIAAARGGWLASRRVRGAVAAGAVAALLVAGLALEVSPNSTAMESIQAQHTGWGALRGEDDALLRLQRMAAMPVRAEATTVAWPESIIGRYEPAMHTVLDLELLRPSRRAGRTQVVGMDLPMPGNRLLNVAMAFYPDGHTATAVARQPAPLSLWKPWRSTDTFVADWTADNMLDLGASGRVAAIFCYEEYLPILFLLDEARDAPSAYLILANTWAAPSPAAGAIQTRHSLGMARLFGRPYVKAENRTGA